MPSIQGLSRAGADRILDIDRVDAERIRFYVHHPRSPEGWKTEVLLQQLQGLMERLRAGEQIEIMGMDQSKRIQFGRRVFTRAPDRPGYSRVWVGPRVKDSSRRSGQGWGINVPTDELEQILRQETAAEVGP